VLEFVRRQNGDRRKLQFTFDVEKRPATSRAVYVRQQRADGRRWQPETPRGSEADDELREQLIE